MKRFVLFILGFCLPFSCLLFTASCRTSVEPGITENIKAFLRPEDPISFAADDVFLDLSKISVWEDSEGNPHGTYNADTQVLNLTTQWKAAAINCSQFDASNYRYVRIDYESIDDGGETNQPFRLLVKYTDGTSSYQLCERKRNVQYYRLEPDSKKSVKEVQIWCTTEKPMAYRINSIRFTQNKILSPSVVDNGNKTFNKSISAINLVKEMGVGWNLGNTFDAHAFGWLENYWERGIEAEFDWEKTETTKELLDFTFDNGYKSIRIPVTWFCHIIDGNYTIDPDWMARVKRVVDMALDSGYYVILNEHHSVHGDQTTEHRTQAGKESEYLTRRMSSPLTCADGYLVSTNQQDMEESKRFLNAIWTQIATAFNNGYDEHLIFETMNEPRNPRDYHNGEAHEWNPAQKIPWHKADGETIGGYWCDNRNCSLCRAEYEVLNEYNQVCLDAIRATGGNNAWRFVMIPGMCTGALTVLPEIEDSERGIFAPGLFRMPNDINSGRLILTVHKYPGWKTEEGNTVFAKRIETDITESLLELNKAFVQKGIPVVIGETGSKRQEISYTERVKWIRHLMGEAKKYGMSVLWWDCGSSKNAYAEIDRKNLCFYETNFVHEMMNAYYE
ncbi:MAG: glycoside hydrolase family 5 protein [Treponema sp.]|nr:glycoside hydrolase family 5 protein [Treponema sp.]